MIDVGLLIGSVLTELYTQSGIQFDLDWIVNIDWYTCCCQSVKRLFPHSNGRSSKL